MNGSAPTLPMTTRLLVLARLLTVQGSYNYETMIGNGIAFAMEPALRLLPGGRGGAAYREALARQAGYFNAHPYLAGLAVGALARAELSFEDPARIERFRTAICGPLGGLGDRLIWAGWLPFCSLLALAAFGLGASALLTVMLFLLTYNAGHISVRVWGLDAGWRHGLDVAPALANPLLQRGPRIVALASVAVAGLAVPLATAAATGSRAPGVLLLTVTGAAGAALLMAVSHRVQGWRAALVFLALAAAAALMGA